MLSFAISAQIKLNPFIKEKNIGINFVTNMSFFFICLPLYVIEPIIHIYIHVLCRIMKFPDEEETVRNSLDENRLKIKVEK